LCVRVCSQLVQEGTGGKHTGIPNAIVTNCNNFFWHPQMGQKALKKLLELGCLPHGEYDWKTVKSAIDTACTGE
jgi:hypothetical protein